MHDHDPYLDTLIIDTVSSIVIVADRQGRILRFNSGGTRITGYAAAEVLGKTIWEIFPPPENRAAAKERSARLISGEPLEFQCVWLTRSGQRKHIAFSCRGAPGPSGKLEYSIGAGVDVTDRVIAEQALRESEQRFRTTFNDAAIGMALVDERGRYLHVNRAYAHLTGYTIEELLKMDLIAITHPDDRDPNWNLFQKVCAGELANYLMEKRYITKSGRQVWVQVSASLAGGGVAGSRTIIGLFENISERKRIQSELLGQKKFLEQRVEERTAAVKARTEELGVSEESLREKERIIGSILGSMGDAVYVADAHGVLTTINSTAERLSGPIVPGSQTLAERARRPWFFRADGVTPYAPGEMALSRSARGEAVDDQEVLIRRPECPEVWVSATSRPLYDDAGAFSGAVAVIRDVSERKRHEAALVEAYASQERANTSLRESEQHYKELADSNLRLAREVEHRVRNNLQGLLGLIAAMRSRPASVKAFADALDARLSAMHHVHQVLAEVQWKPILVQQLISGTLMTLRHLAPHAIAVEMAGPEVMVIPAQALPLSLVLVEWFTNSCKYGAHTVPDAALHIRWEVAQLEGPARIRLHWTERGGPPIRGSIVSSLGTELVQGFSRGELRGKSELRYPTGGADHLIEFPLAGESERIEYGSLLGL